MMQLMLYLGRGHSSFGVTSYMVTGKKEIDAKNNQVINSDVLRFSTREPHFSSNL